VILTAPDKQENGHQGSNPGGHSFNFLNVSIDKKPFFFSEVVTYKKPLREPPTGHASFFC